MEDIVTLTSKKEYDEKFHQGTSTHNFSDNLREKALNHALDIRKFEIELYWKRATYFWAFIAAAFVGYLGMFSTNDKTRPDIILLICTLGLSFSISWYFVNRGSKFWQNNWERHVDLLEDEIIGPLYKTAIDKRTCFFRELHKEYPFSVSKINQLLSLYVVIIWLFLTINSFISVIKNNEYKVVLNSLIILTISFIFYIILCLYGTTDQHDSLKNINRKDSVLIIRKSFFDKNTKKANKLCKFYLIVKNFLSKMLEFSRLIRNKPS